MGPISGIKHLREETPGCEHCIHLNNAGAGLMPKPVLTAMVEHLNREANFGGYESADAAGEAVQEAYADIARLIGTLPRNIAVVENATVAFFQALAVFDFRQGDVIVTTRNDYVSNQLAYLSLARRRGVEVHRASDLETGGVDPQSVQDLVRNPRVRLLAVTWAPTNSGLIQPVEQLGEIAEAARVPYLVDACQAVGQLPVNLERLRCDFLSATARKFLRGPRGIGFLYASDRALNRGDCPLHLDMRAAEWTTPDTYQVVPDARRFENWEFAYALLLGLGQAARYASSVGVEAGGQRARELAATIRKKLEGVAGFRVLDRGAELSAIVTVEVAGRNPSELVKLMRQRRINVSATFREWAIIDMDEKRAQSALRISPHYYNTEEEVTAAVEAVKSLRL